MGLFNDILGVIGGSPLNKWQVPNRMPGVPEFPDEDNDPNDEDDIKGVKPFRPLGIPTPQTPPVTEPVAPSIPVPEQPVPQPSSVNTGSGEQYPLKYTGVADLLKQAEELNPPGRGGRPQYYQPPVPQQQPPNGYNAPIPTTDPQTGQVDTNNQSGLRQPVPILPIYKQRLDKAVQERTRLESMRPQDLDQKKDGWFKNFGKALLMNLPNLSAVLQNPNMTDKQALMASLGTVLASGLRGAIDPYGDERMSLEYKKAQADKEIEDASGVYDKEMGRAYNQARIDDYYDKQAQRERRNDQRDVELENKKFEYATRRINSITALMKTGMVDPKDNDELIKSLSDMTNAKVVFSGFNPATDKIAGMKVVQDAEGNKAYWVTYTAGGAVKSDYVRDGAGNIAYIKDPRVKAEEIRASTNLEVTKQRTMSAERIAKLNNDTRTTIASMNLTQKEIDGVQDEFDTMYKMTDEDEVVKAAAARAGRKVESLTQDEKDNVIEEYYTNMRDKIVKNRGLTTKPKDKK